MSKCAYCHILVNTEANDVALVFCCRSCEFLYRWNSDGEAPVPAQPKASLKWQNYNNKGLLSRYNRSLDLSFNRFRFYVEGLQCSSCVHLLEELPQFCDKIIAVRVNYGERSLDLQAQTDMGLGDLCQIISDLGYVPQPLGLADQAIEAQRAEDKQDLKRLGVAAAVAGNEMLFAVPLYAGLEGQLALVFRWISFFIFLPLLLYSAQGFFKRAWSALRVHQLSVDMMIVVALTLGFVFSTFSLISGGQELYFDSTASFIFLILVTRFFLRKYQRRYLKKDILSEIYANELYELEDEQSSQLVSYDEIRAGQKLKIKYQQILPCDLQLKTLACEVDTSFLTGEAYPHKCHVGDVLRAGSRVLSENITGVAINNCKDTTLAQSLSDITLQKINRRQSLTDLVSHRLTLTVFSLAGLYFLFFFQSQGVEAFKRSLALLTIACPCAVAFGTPLAQGLGIRKALKKGFFVRTESVFEEIIKIKKIIFDKTGTLTSNDLKLLKVFPENIDEHEKSLILGLEQNSLHPVALSLKKAWPHIEPHHFLKAEERIGEGTQAVENGQIYQLGKAVQVQNENEMQVGFSINGQIRCYLYFEESIRPEAKRVIEKLYNMQADVKMLSGDLRPRALEAARQLGIRPSHVFSEQSADEKKLFIEKENPCLYAGDGLNDLTALKSAQVSFAVRGPFEATFQVCDVFAPKQNLYSLVEFIELSQQVQKVIQTNLLFALIYNSVGGVLALAGFINPLVAAVLMPLSSILITTHTVWRLT